jgi:hypothetical protein
MAAINCRVSVGNRESSVDIRVCIFADGRYLKTITVMLMPASWFPRTFPVDNETTIKAVHSSETSVNFYMSTWRYVIQLVLFNLLT